ncbi:MAG: endonuclease/exonuclease/phosphatase family protein [Phycisphaerales bacterium]|nr:endonuclease/exonuclease/phosphatase family protein [Phycisphaerales bacterium]
MTAFTRSRARSWHIWAACLLLTPVACERNAPPQPATPAATSADAQSSPTATAPPASVVAAPPAVASAAPQVRVPVAPPPVPIPPREPTRTFLDRPEAAGVFRVVSYNIKWNSIFPAVSKEGAEKFARVFRALDPDVIGLQEIGRNPSERDNPAARTWTADDVRQLLDQLRPLPGGARWHAYGANSNVIASKYPLQMTSDRVRPPGERGPAIALVDLPTPKGPRGLYVVNTHHKCCDGTKNDPRRQVQSDAIMAWIRDARQTGGEVDLEDGTGIVILGDFNLVGGQQPLVTLTDGDIVDEQRFGADFEPDWDETSLTDAKPMHNIDGSESWTWRDDNQPFEPGRLDFIVYSDSVLEAVKKFGLNTTAMADEELEAAGLQRWDVCKDDIGREYDHLPLVVDFVYRGVAGAAEAPGEEGD